MSDGIKAKNPRIVSNYDPGISLFHPSGLLKPLSVRDIRLIRIQAGLLTSGSPFLPLPSQSFRSVATPRLQSPVTAAGPSPILTGFPV